MTETVEAGNPWAQQDAIAVREQSGAEIEWKHGWKFTARRKATWCKLFQVAANRIMSRADVAAFLKRIQGRAYKQTPADVAYWQGVQREILVDGNLVGWSGVIGPDGKPLAYTRANAMLLLSKFPALEAFLLEAVGDEANFEGFPEPGEPSTEEKVGN
jgi:hypothetical protein